MPKGRKKSTPYVPSKRATEISDRARLWLQRTSELLREARDGSGLFIKTVVAKAQADTPTFSTNTLSRYINPKEVEAMGDLWLVNVLSILAATGITAAEWGARLDGAPATLTAEERSLLQMFRILPTAADRGMLLAMAQQMVHQRQLADVPTTGSLTKQQVTRDIEEHTSQGEPEEPDR